ncbi:glycosyltransferase (activator-dependent family) [Catenulispora sp. EB89]|uniref:nucleotide disphospho-sugar-binding domain-containing protein n=1 Tax=Catenulispora sp. EB89 TaxID=3156257 RepID=UPI0035134489
MNRLRVLLVTGAWKSHLYQMVPLAWALQSAGHEVRVAADRGFAGSIAETGLIAVPVGSDESLAERFQRARGADAPKMSAQVPAFMAGTHFQDALFHLGGGPREELNPEELAFLLATLLPAMWMVNDEMVEDLVDYCRFWQPDLVLRDVVAHAGGVAADVVGAAHGRVMGWNDTFHRVRRDLLSAQRRRPAEPDHVRGWYEGWAEQYGRPFTEETITGQFAVNVLPERWRLEPHDRTLSMRYVPFNGPSVVPSWLTEPPRAPRVLMTFGISRVEWVDAVEMTRDHVQEMLDAAADLDVELIVTLPKEDRDRLRGVPKNTRVVEFVPMNVLLPTCTAVIHHGGAGCFNSAMVYGIPQIIVEGSVDAIAKRRMLHETGAGVSLTLDAFSGPVMRDHITSLIKDDAFREGAERLRQEALGHPTPDELVPELERIASEHRARRSGGAGSRG